MPQYLVTVRSRRDPDAPQQLYLLDGELAAADVQSLTDELLHDSVVQEAAWCALGDLAERESSSVAGRRSFVEVAFKPGVTDNEAESIKIGATRMGITSLRAVMTLRRYPLDATEDQLATALAGLYNSLIQIVLIARPEEPARETRQTFYETLLRPPAEAAALIARVPLLEAADDDLTRISQAAELVAAGVGGGAALRAGLADLKAAWQGTRVV